jgi:phage shock protein A
MTFSLRISADIHDWLARLRGGDPAAARAVGAAVLAVLDAGTALGHPAVVPVAPELRPSEPGTVLDDAYLNQLHMLQRVRRGVADVATSRKRTELQVDVLVTAVARHQAEVDDAVSTGQDELARGARDRRATAEAQLADLRSQLDALTAEEHRMAAACQRLQAKVDAFRIRKEAVKARYPLKSRHTAGDVMRAAQEAFQSITDMLRSLLATTPEADWEEAAAAAAAVRGLLEEARLAERDLRAAASDRPEAGARAAAEAPPGAAARAGGGLQVPPGVMELRPCGPGARDHRILFRVADGEASLLARVPDDGDYELAILQANASLQ